MERIQLERPDSPVGSCASMKSDRSMGGLINFKDGHHSEKTGIQLERPDSPVGSCVSMKSERSMGGLINFKDGHDSEKTRIQQDRPTSPVSSCMSMKSDRSMGGLINFKDGRGSEKTRIQQERPDSPVGSCVSMKSDRSMGGLINFKDGHGSEKTRIQQDRPTSPVGSCVSMRSDRSMGGLINFEDGRDIKGASCVSMKSDRSMGGLINFKDGSDSLETGVLERESEATHPDPAQKYQSYLESSFKLLEQNISMFVQAELENLQKTIASNTTEEEEDVRKMESEEEKENESSRENLMKILVEVLRSMGSNELANYLQNGQILPLCRQKLKSHLRKKFNSFFEGIAKAGHLTHLNNIYTELYITEAGRGVINDEHEIRQIETASRHQSRPEHLIKCEDIFQPFPGRDFLPVRTVLTKGVAGIGKTVLTQKFTLSWAENKANHNIHFTFPFTFRELNLLSGKNYSFVELLHLFFTETKDAGIYSLDKFNVVFILDGLDECRLPLDFHNNEIVTDVTESTTVDALLTNLIAGKLLPDARLWITTRPAAAGQIPPRCVDLVTEVRGFTDTQKKEYFEKRFRKEGQARRIINHIKTSRSLHIMCHIPVFCWITASVLEPALKADENRKLPKTLTDMYIRFLVARVKAWYEKYHGAESDALWNTHTCNIIMSLGKLAFEQLQKGNLVFYDSDLLASDIDIKAASAYSGLFMQICKEERGLYQNKLYCFVHLSVQEFLAALYVYVKFTNAGENLLSEPQPTSTLWQKLLTLKIKEKNIFQAAVDKALESPNGHLDLFLRFLLGLSLETNQTLLQGLLKHTGSDSRAAHQRVQYIKEKIQENPSPERCINLFYCLNELQDNTLVEEIQQSLQSGSLCTDKLSPVQWSALVFILLSSEKDLDEFDLRDFQASEEALLWLLPVVKNSKTAVLSGCNLSERSCEALASVLRSKNSSLRVLDLSNNNLRNSGVKLLSSGLGSPHCKLEVLSLAGCLVTEEGCAALASALNSNPCHLRELDLSYNNPGDSGVMLLSAALENPRLQLSTLSVEHGGVHRLKSGPKKFACKLTLDPNTAHSRLSLSRENRKATVVLNKLPYPEHPERFHHWKQVLCREGLTGRCYWVVAWEGWVNIGVTYKGIKRKGQDDDCWIGQNDKSWSLLSCDRFSACHKNQRTVIPIHSSVDSGRVAVYLDWPAGTLTFYNLSSDTLSHLHTFRCKFTQPLYPAFGIESNSKSSVCLC